MDPYCRGCAYRQKLEGGGTICGYAVITDHLRGCPAGAGCTHKTSERPAHKNIAVIGHDKQVHAEAQHMKQAGFPTRCLRERRTIKRYRSTPSLSWPIWHPTIQSNMTVDSAWPSP